MTVVFFQAACFHCAAFALLFPLAGCGGDAGRGKAAAGRSAGDYFPIAVAGHKVRMQIAARPDEMEKGLMYRTSLGADEGMLFVYSRPQALSFWMRHTRLPLDIGYFDAEGELKEVYQMYPRDERPMKSRGSRLQFALEMNQGWFAENGISSGAKLDLAAVAAALCDRGLHPETMGLTAGRR